MTHTYTMTKRTPPGVGIGERAFIERDDGKKYTVRFWAGEVTMVQVTTKEFHRRVLWYKRMNSTTQAPMGPVVRAVLSAVQPGENR